MEERKRCGYHVVREEIDEDGSVVGRCDEKLAAGGA